MCARCGKEVTSLDVPSWRVEMTGSSSLLVSEGSGSMCLPEGDDTEEPYSPEHIADLSTTAAIEEFLAG